MIDPSWVVLSHFDGNTENKVKTGPQINVGGSHICKGKIRKGNVI